MPSDFFTLISRTKVLNVFLVIMRVTYVVYVFLYVT